MDKLSELKETYLRELEALKAISREKEKELFMDNKSDEANFEKIKVNIFEIFTTLFHAEIKKGGSFRPEDEAAKYEEFCKKYLITFVRIPEAWRKKLDYADKHDLPAEKAVEEIKLETADAVKDLFIKTVKGIGV